jgi:predicted nucleotidyltransferase
MRLTQQQTHLITQAIYRLAGTHARVFLFGSRLNDNAKGGDVDILIETETPLSLIERAKIKLQFVAWMQR